MSKRQKKKALVVKGEPDVEMVTKVEYIYEDTRATTGVEPDYKWGEIYRMISNQDVPDAGFEELSSMGISVLVADSRTVTEFSSQGEPLYLNSVGPLFNGEGTLEVSLNEYGINDVEAKKSFFQLHATYTNEWSTPSDPRFHLA